MAKYRKKPVVIDAIQLRWDTWNEVAEFVDIGCLADGKPEGFNPHGDPTKVGIKIPTCIRLVEAEENDWIIRDANGLLYVCTPHTFERVYEPVAGDEDLKAKTNILTDGRDLNEVVELLNRSLGILTETAWQDVGEIGGLKIKSCGTLEDIQKA